MNKIIRADHWSEINPNDWPAENFPPEEFACRGPTGAVLADVDFLIWLQRVRWAYGKAMPLTRGYSTPEHNATIPGASPTSFHMKGQAVDVAIGAGPDAAKLISILGAHKAHGVCMRLHGDRPYVHIDRGGRIHWWTKP